MKTKLLLSLFLSFSFYLLSSQVPQGFNYQAIARDGSGKPIVGSTIKVKLSVLTDTTGFQTGSGGIYVWEEEHNGVLTNSYGLFTIVLGDPSAVRVKGVANFSLIDWNQPKLFLGTKIANPETYQVLGGAKLWSVPYSMVAGELGGTVDKIKVKGKEVEPDSALFEVRNRNGQIVFAVYNEGVRVYVDDGVKGNTKGGFAIGGFGSDKGTSQNYLMVSRDSIRAYVNDTIKKGITKGGFAIGGFGTAKTTNHEYFRVTRDSTRINVYDDGTKGNTKGGFAIGGFDNSKGAVTPFTALSQDNYFIGHEAGLSNTTGKYNSFFGYKAGESNTSGTYNVFIGHYSGTLNKDGYANLFIGDSAGYKNSTGHFNVALGAWAGQENSTGNYNVSLGTNAGLFNQTGGQNVNIGTQAGARNISGTRNTNVGSSAGENNTLGSYNVALGNFAGFTATSGDGNVYLGSYTGRNNLAGNWNVFIGYAAGRDELNSERLYIANNATPSPLIYGEFDNGRVVIQGNATSNFNNRTFFVNGTAGGSSSWWNDSDRKLKHDIVAIPDALQKVLKMRGVNFLWNDPKEGMEGLQMGFIGQETVEVIPEVVALKNDRYSMQYAPVTALLVEAIKEQQQQIESARQKNQNLESDLQLLRVEMEQIKAMLAKGGVK